MSLAMISIASAQEIRSARPLPPTTHAGEATAFTPAESAALFVGIRRFADSKLIEVPYAVDDAVDLAFVLALDPRVGLVAPERVVLALSGQPQKPDSEQHLNALKARGAMVCDGNQTDILMRLEEQAAKVGKNGILVVAFATHGFTDGGGTHYLIAANSLLRYEETSLSETKIRDLASRTDSGRSLVILDACRERLTADRGAASDRASAAPAIRPMRGVKGQAVLAAAAAGGWAYDDPERRNGVFTSALIDGLTCSAPADSRGWITIPLLARYATERVTSWVTKHGNPAAPEGIQLLYDGAMELMPLAVCGAPRPTNAPAPAHRPGEPALVRAAGGSFTVFDDDGFVLWSGKVDGTVVRGEAADLDGDGKKEIVVGVASGGDGGRIFVYDRSGKPLWSADTTTQLNYEGGHSGRMVVVDFVTGDLFRRGTRQVVVVSIDAEGWFPSKLTVFDGNGKTLGNYWHPGHLHHVIVGAASLKDPPRIIAAGVSNDLAVALNLGGRPACVFALDPANVQGEAPPYAGSSGQGSHLWYGVILPPGQTIDRLSITDRDRDGTNEISVWTSSRTVFYLDFRGGLVARAVGDGATATSEFALIVSKK